MDGTSQGQSGRLKRFWDLVNVLEFVFEAAQCVKIDLTARKVVNHSSLLLTLQVGVRSFCSLQAWKPLLGNQLGKGFRDVRGPRLEHILRHSLFTLLECPQSTLLDLPRLLTDKEFRKGVLKHLNSKPVREFWLYEFEKYSAWLRSEAISPILNKMGQFLTNLPLRNIVGQKENTFDLRKVMNERKILIVNLAKGKIGEENSHLLGAMIVTKIQLAALSRVDLPEEKRAPFYLYVDELHNFITLSFADILSEARKYGLNLILAHQYIGQLDEKIRAAVFGNVGTIISFRVGAEDAKYLAKEYSPVFDESDLVNLPNYHIYLKLMIDGKTSQPFSAITLPVSEKRELIKRKSLKSQGEIMPGHEVK